MAMEMATATVTAMAIAMATATTTAIMTKGGLPLHVPAMCHVVAGATPCLHPHGHKGKCIHQCCVMGVRMCDCCMEGIEPCKCKGNGHQWIGNQVFRLAEEEKK